MAQKQLNGRIALKHDLEVNWVAAAQRSNFTPNPGEIIIYDPDENHAQARIKIGDGARNVEELPFYSGSWNDLSDKPFYEINEIDGEIKTLDSKFIGDDIARVSEVPSFEDLDTVSATAAAAINEVNERVDEVVEAKADWNQNDETALDYIKNRTHWVERATEILLPERTVEESYTQLSELDGVEFWLGNTMYFTYNTLIITFDGIKYELNAFAHESRPHWGNSSLIADNTNVIDVPFLLETNWGTPEGQLFGDEIPVWYINYDSSVIGNHHTVKIETVNGELVHKLDEKFIPDTIARKADLNNIDLSNFYSKSEIDNMEFITVDDIDTICGR